MGRASLALADRPMSLLQGDVHHADIAVQDQAQPIRLRLIAHIDMSSLFLWATPVLLSKGQGIVQADVAEALAHLTMSPHGGISEHFYLDNGSQYAALAAAMGRLSYLAQDQFGLTLAKPYSPTSKGSIEGLSTSWNRSSRACPAGLADSGTTRRPQTRGRPSRPMRGALGNW